VRVSLREMRAVFAALAANLGIALAKFVAFLITGSASMLAESVHSVADTGNEVLLLVGGREDLPNAIAFSSAVVHPKRCTGWLSRLGGMAT